MYLVHQMAPYGVYLLLMQETKQEIKSIFLISSPRRTLYSLSAAVPVPADVCCDCQETRHVFSQFKFKTHSVDFDKACMLKHGIQIKVN